MNLKLFDVLEEKESDNGRIYYYKDTGEAYTSGK